MALLRIAAPVRARRGVQASARIWCVVCGFLLLGGPEPSAQTAPPAEYQIKAVFLFNFAQFTEWPPAAFADATSPLIIGVLGTDPFGAYLDETVRNEKVNNRPLAIQRYRRVDEIKTCHILFISRSETEAYEQIFARLQGRSILTVGDAEGFATRGMIRFLTEQNRIRLRVNLGAGKAAGLTISAKVLRSAEIVGAERTR
jgi:hypothetical protein